MKIADKIGEYKKQNNITILQTNRWNEILARSQRRLPSGCLSNSRSEHVAQNDLVDSFPFDASRLDGRTHDVRPQIGCRDRRQHSLKLADRRATGGKYDDIIHDQSPETASNVVVAFAGPNDPCTPAFVVRRREL